MDSSNNNNNNDDDNNTEETETLETEEGYKMTGSITRISRNNIFRCDVKVPHLFCSNPHHRQNMIQEWTEEEKEQMK